MGNLKKRKKSPRPPSKILQRFDSPDTLAGIGPVVHAAWTIPSSLAAVFEAEGRRLPPPVEGMMLIDTGAQRTCISKHAAELLGLKPIRITKGYGAGGIHENPVYLAHMMMAIRRNSDGATTQINLETEAQGIPELDKHAPIVAGGQSVTLVGLLGRDLLRFARLDYNGYKGQFEMVFRLKDFQKALAR